MKRVTIQISLLIILIMFKDRGSQWLPQPSNVFTSGWTAEKSKI